MHILHDYELVVLHLYERVTLQLILYVVKRVVVLRGLKDDDELWNQRRNLENNNVFVFGDCASIGEGWTGN